jgi:hypothetical protein
MFVVTNNKVAGFRPLLWAGFRGFSFLFDNPGNSFRSKGDVEEIACVPEAEGELTFYGKLQEAIPKTGGSRLINEYLFCPLPVASYHVTVCDGINADNLDMVPEEHRADLAAFLRGLPSSLRQMPISLRSITESELAVCSVGRITFGFKKLTIWGNKVMVARLKPADTESAECLSELEKTRAVLCERMEKVFGIKMSHGYSPHVSLGYFANLERAELASGQLAQWTEKFNDTMSTVTISFESLSLYGFTDMATFFRTLSAGLKESTVVC